MSFVFIWVSLSTDLVKNTSVPTEGVFAGTPEKYLGCVCVHTPANKIYYPGIGKFGVPAVLKIKKKRAKKKRTATPTARNWLQIIDPKLRQSIQLTLRHGSHVRMGFSRSQMPIQRVTALKIGSRDQLRALRSRNGP